MHTRRSPFPRLLALLALAPLAACVTTDALARLSSGFVGCPSDEVKITDKRVGQVAQWRAECRGRKFFCSAAGQAVSCAPEQPSTPAAQ